MRLTRVGRLWRTVRHLRMEQVLGRAWFRVRRPRPDLRPAPSPRPATGAWAVPAMREPSLRDQDRFSFLHVEHTLGPGPAAWDDPVMERLWRYNLHYFDDLNAAGHAQRATAHRALVARWIAENPPGHGTGWEPYPTSLRIANWIKWFVAGAPAEPAWLDSLAVQARWLTRRIEWHLLGNHLFVNAKALVMAGLFFDGEEAGSWLRRGLAILQRELPEQILPDGGQFERSPMYHALALEDLLDLLNIIQARAPAATPVHALRATLGERAASMLLWLRCMTHPDGSLARFNDCADGIAPAVPELERYAAALGIAAPLPGEPLAQLPASGYVRATRGGAVLLVDVARLGPEYLLGHAHADTLSFELSLAGRRVVVNGGTSCYGVSDQRLRERGTAAHSTVEVAGRDSSEVWSGFRVGRRAYPVGLQVEGTRINCAHDGYRFLPGAPEHRRTWMLTDRMLEVEDCLAPDRHAAVARYPIAPGLTLAALDSGTWRIDAGGTPLATVQVLAGRARAVASRHAAGFGVVVPNETLEVTLTEGRARTRWSWNHDAHPVPH